MVPTQPQIIAGVSDKKTEKPPASEELTPELAEKPTEEASGMSVDSLRKYLADKLGFSDKEEDEEEHIKVLDTVDLDGIVNFIKEKKCKKIITMAGAGISTCNKTNYIRL